MQWCIPSNITDLIKQYKEQLQSILGPTNVEMLPNAVKNIEYLAEFEGVSLEQQLFHVPDIIKMSALL